MEVGTVVIHLARHRHRAVADRCRRLGWAGLAAVAALFAVVLRGYGQDHADPAVEPVPARSWRGSSCCSPRGRSLCGDAVALVPLVVAATYCAQTHVPYLPLGVGMVVLGLVAGPSCCGAGRRAAGPGRPSRTATLWAAGAGVVLWLPPLADQIRNDPGQHPPAARPLRLASGGGDRVRRGHPRSRCATSTCWTGVAAPAVRDRPVRRRRVGVARRRSCWPLWAVAACVAVAVRHRPRALRALHLVVAVALLLGIVSTARIFGRPWYYLTLWAWGTTLLAARRHRVDGRGAVAAAPAAVPRRAPVAVTRRRRGGRRGRRPSPPTSPSPTPTIPRSA